MNIATGTLIIAMLPALILCNTHAFAQKQVKEMESFVPREHVIFYDDFTDNTQDSFPKLWYIRPCNGKAYTTTKMCYVDKTDNNAALVISSEPRKTYTTGNNYIEPEMKQTRYMPDSFTLQYDFKLGSPQTTMLLLFNNGGCVFVTFELGKSAHPGWQVTLTNNTMSHTVSIAPDFDSAAWHHMDISYKKRNLQCYLDDNLVLSMADCGFTPDRFVLSAEDDNTVSYTNVRLATGKKLVGEEFSFGKMYTSKKFVTHAIHFDVNKAIIRPESDAFMQQLAKWLKQHPSLKMEIDGHTDNDGSDERNLKLSQERAEAVKQYLVTAGIKDDRLTAKGYGASRPLQPNTSPEGKAVNRRVEFIKK